MYKNNFNKNNNIQLRRNTLYSFYVFSWQQSLHSSSVWELQWLYTNRYFHNVTEGNYFQHLAHDRFIQPQTETHWWQGGIKSRLRDARHIVRPT